jgi:ABC-type Zn uptake system ZnuABC Zn-binding protein ZnuA
VRTILRIAAAAGLLALAGCGESGGQGDGSVRVVATTPQVADIARAVAGRRAEVGQILRPGIDAHEFEPRPSDARALAEGDVLVSSGGGLDQWVGDLASTAGFDGPRVEVFDDLRLSGKDPHWWQDPRNAQRAVREIGRALGAADPAGRATYARNARAYARRLRRMDRSIAACVSRVPAAKRKLVTTHDAFGRYARRYDIDVVGALIPSLSTQAQPSGRDVQRLVDQIRAEHVEAIFPETKLNPRLERAVSSEAGVRVGSGLWADTLGPPGSPAGTYLGALAVNTARLVQGMSGGRVRCRPVG